MKIKADRIKDLEKLNKYFQRLFVSKENETIYIKTKPLLGSENVIAFIQKDRFYLSNGKFFGLNDTAIQFVKFIKEWVEVENK